MVDEFPELSRVTSAGFGLCAPWTKSGAGYSVESFDFEITLSQFWNGKASGKYAALKSYMLGTEET